MSGAAKATAKRSPKKATESASSKAAYVVGDIYVLQGHALVSYPDGTVVTANGTFTFRLPGEYRVTYNNDAFEPATVTVKEASK